MHVDNKCMRTRTNLCMYACIHACASTGSLAGDVNMLVCTDLAARGLDLHTITKVPVSHLTLTLALARPATCEWTTVIMVR